MREWVSIRGVQGRNTTHRVFSFFHVLRTATRQASWANHTLRYSYGVYLYEWKPIRAILWRLPIYMNRYLFMVGLNNWTKYCVWIKSIFSILMQSKEDPPGPK